MYKNNHAVSKKMYQYILMSKKSNTVHNGKGGISSIYSDKKYNILIMEDDRSNKIRYIGLNNLIKQQLIKSISTVPKKYETGNYEKATSFILPGKITGVITKISFVSFMDKNGSDYTIRLYDIINNTVISEINLKNIINEINKFDTLSNIPVNDTIVEIQCVFNGDSDNKFIYLDEMVIFYDGG